MFVAQVDDGRLEIVDGVQRILAETAAPPGSQRRASLLRALGSGGGGGGADSRGGTGGGVPKFDFLAMFDRTSLLDRLSVLKTQILPVIFQNSGW